MENYTGFSLMKNQITFYPASERGHADHGWLKTWHSFSFAGFYDPDKVHFGALRVLNDDVVAGGMGFGTHPHDNMEIITIPLSGDLQHKDSMGNTSVIKQGDVQVMSAGTGILHSEFNPNKNQETRLLQIWVFPSKRNVTPRYQQITINQSNMQNKLLQVVSPNEGDEGVWIHQNAWFNLGRFDAGHEVNYALHDAANGLYVFVLEGVISTLNHNLQQRDAIGIEGESQISIQVAEPTQLLLMEVPMHI